jgi:hypothetical protein
MDTIKLNVVFCPNFGIPVSYTTHKLTMYVIIQFFPHRCLNHLPDGTSHHHSEKFEILFGIKRRFEEASKGTEFCGD